MSWTVVFLNHEIKAEFLAIPVDIRADLARIFTLIETYGLVAIGMPYVRHVQDKLWEIRGRGKSGIGRSLYVAHSGQRVVILRTFVKTTQKTPQREINLALIRAKDIEDGASAGLFARNDE